MYTRDFPDGKLTIQATGNGNPPDRQYGQHTNRSTVWARIDEGPWHYVDGVRSMHKAREEADACDTAAEAIQWLCTE